MKFSFAVKMHKRKQVFAILVKSTKWPWKDIVTKYPSLTYADTCSFHRHPEYIVSLLIAYHVISFNLFKLTPQTKSKLQFSNQSQTNYRRCFNTCVGNGRFYYASFNYRVIYSNNIFIEQPLLNVPQRSNTDYMILNMLHRRVIDIIDALRQFCSNHLYCVKTTPLPDKPTCDFVGHVCAR